MPTAYFLNKVYTRRPFVSAAKFIEFNFNKWTRYILYIEHYDQSIYCIYEL